MKITIIAAADALWGIGFEGRLPWSCPEDLARFRRRTFGCALVMGRITANSVGHHLPGRTILTVSSTGMTIEQAVRKARSDGFEECFIAGGQRVYEGALGIARTAEITRIAGDHRCDTRMPNLDLLGWGVVARERLSDRAEVEFREP